LRKPPEQFEEDAHQRPLRPSARNRPERDDEEDEPLRPKPARFRPDREDEEDDPRPKRKAAARREQYDDEDGDRPVRRKRKKKDRGSAILVWSLIGGAVLAFGSLGVALILILNNNAEFKKSFLMGNGPGDAGWVPTAAMLNELGPEVPIEGYRLRPPLGFNQSTRQRGQAVQHFFKSPARADGTFATFLVGTIDIPPTESDQPEQLMGSILAALKKEARQAFPVIAHTKMESGKVNGLTFYRSYMKGSNAGKTVEGFVYLTLEGRKVFVVTFLDLSPYVANTFKVAEAAALTCNK
jgi:hypothetical protein